MEDIKKLIDAINNGLAVVKTVADLPGVSALPYAATLSSAISAIKIAVEAGQTITPYVEAIAATFSSETAPTEEQLAALDAKIEVLRAGLQADLPEKEEGEED